MHKTIAAKRRLLITEFRGFDMTKHLFLTGEKGIGKSSLIKVLLKRSFLRLSACGISCK